MTAGFWMLILSPFCYNLDYRAVKRWEKAFHLSEGVLPVLRALLRV